MFDSRVLCGFATLVGLLAGCDDSESPGNADVRFVHLAPSAGPVDIVVDAASPPAVTSLAFESATQYLSIPGGAHDVSIRAAGTSTVALALDDLDIPEGSRITAVAWGVSSVRAALVDDSSEGLASGSFRLNVVHAAEGVGQVDLWNVPTSGSPSPLITDFDEGEQDSLDLPAGAYRIGVDVDDDAVPDLLFDVPSLTAGLVVDAFAVLDGDDVVIAAVLPTGAVAVLSPTP